MLQYLENGSILKLACLNKRFAAIVEDLKGFGLIWKMKSLQEVLSTAEQDEALLKCAGFGDSEIIDPLYQYNNDLNKNYTLEEVTRIATNSKNNKSTGTDKLPNEVFKNRYIIEILQKLFQLCFDSGKIPNIWRKSLISPIVKSEENDSRIPSLYRGISLINCSAKLYSALLNDCICKYLESKNL